MLLNNNFPNLAFLSVHRRTYSHTRTARNAYKVYGPLLHTHSPQIYIQTNTHTGTDPRWYARCKYTTIVYFPFMGFTMGCVCVCVETSATAVASGFASGKVQHQHEQGGKRDSHSQTRFVQRYGTGRHEQWQQQQQARQ